MIGKTSDLPRAWQSGTGGEKANGMTQRMSKSGIFKLPVAQRVAGWATFTLKKGLDSVIIIANVGPTSL
jgi:hypothetical protein